MRFAAKAAVIDRRRHALDRHARRAQRLDARSCGRCACYSPCRAAARARIGFSVTARNRRDRAGRERERRERGRRGVAGRIERHEAREVARHAREEARGIDAYRRAEFGIDRDQDRFAGIAQVGLVGAQQHRRGCAGPAERAQFTVGVQRLRIARHLVGVRDAFREIEVAWPGPRGRSAKRRRAFATSAR